MEKMQMNSENFIEATARIFEGTKAELIKKDIDYAKKANTKKKGFLNTFFKKYEKAELNGETCLKMLKDIISQIIKIRKDFELFIKIYLTTTDAKKLKTLREHFVAENKELKKLDNESTESTSCEFGVSLECAYDTESYYHKFIKGILRYFLLIFKKNYLYEFIELDYFRNDSLSKYYKEHISSLEYSLNKMLNDINRIIFEDSQKNINGISENIVKKMTSEKFEVFLIKAHLLNNKEIKKIYENSKSNDEILKVINEKIVTEKDNKESDLYYNLITLREDIEAFIQKEKDDKEFAQMKKSNEENIAQINYNKTTIAKLTKENQDLYKMKEEMKELKEEKGRMINNINNLNTRVNTLETKVNFMEPIVLSIITRKAVNYAIIQILKNYKKSIQVTQQTLENGDFNYTIKFIDSVNGVTKENLNGFINYLFSRKDELNKVSHLIGKKLPHFIEDLWEKVKAFLNLNEDDKTSFDAIITQEIKSGFIDKRLLEKD